MATTDHIDRMQPIKHREWEDNTMMLLGIAIFLSSLFFPITENRTAILGVMLTGALIVMLGMMEMVNLHRWEEILAFLAGLWMIASPYALDYIGPLRFWHVGLGICVALIAALQIWQDRNRRFEV